MTIQLLQNSFFKTIEYTIKNSDTLELSELSMSGKTRSNSILLNNISDSESQSIPPFVSWMVLFIGCVLVASVIYLSQTSSIVHSNLLNIIFFLASITCAFAFITKPEKIQVYRDSHSNQILFKLKNDSHTKLTNQKFIIELNTAIRDAKDIESNKINLKTNVKLQYDIHNKNVDDLFNLGFIDEALYNRICRSMHDKVFGKVNRTKASDNVIYLNQ